MRAALLALDRFGSDQLDAAFREHLNLLAPRRNRGRQ
jgi:hypothetical protein